MFQSAARVDIHDDGSPTGFPIEWQAMALALDAVPLPDLGSRADGLLSLLAAMADSGLTAGQVLDYTPGMIEVLETAEARDDLPIRLLVSPWIQAGDTESRVAEVIALQGRHGRRWAVDGVKLMIDGTIDNGSAWLERPDVNGESTRPLWLDATEYTQVLHRLSGLGISTTTHAIGDAGVRHVAESIAAAPNPARVTHRVEHIETAPDETLALFGAHGIAASMQPTHCTLYCSADGSDNWSRRLGDDRVTRAWRLRSLRDLGVPVATGSDWPVAPFEPLRIMADAQLRREAGRPAQDPIVPAEALGGGPHGPPGPRGLHLRPGRLLRRPRAGTDPRRRPGGPVPLRGGPAPHASRRPSLGRRRRDVGGRKAAADLRDHSVRPMRACRRRNGSGAHQFQSPRMVIVAGTSSIRTRVASMTTAVTRATPISLMTSSCPAAKPAKTMQMSSAAEVMMRPDRCRPSATLRSFGTPLR